MHATTLLPTALLLLLPTTLAAVKTTFRGCNYQSIGVEPWYNCNDMNGGVDPCGQQQNCFAACGRAGSNDKPGDFVMVAEVDAPDMCGCKCYLK